MRVLWRVFPSVSSDANQRSRAFKISDLGWWKSLECTEETFVPKIGCRWYSKQSSPLTEAAAVIKKILATYKKERERLGTHE